MTIKRHVPNIITLLNLLSGCIALIFAFGFHPGGNAVPNFEMAFIFVSLGIFLDFFDGFFARIFNAGSPIGLQLDSLADMVTSGVVPGVIMFQMLSNTSIGFGTNDYLPYFGFIITLGSCYRLAKFNVDERQTDSFIGLPTPANALLILSLPLVLANTDSMLMLQLLVNPYVLIAISIFSAYILNAEIPLFSLKVKKFSLKNNAIQIIFLVLSLILLVAFEYLGIPLLILLYILMSVIVNKRTK